jgi:hypothetical protein
MRASNWYRLTPDIHGSYITGTWSNLASMNNARAYYSSAVLKDGRVFVAGGEYSTGNGGSKAELYEPAKDSWTEIPVPPGLICANCINPGFSDSTCMLLADGTVMISPVTPANPGGTVIFDPTSNTFSQGPILTNSAYNTDEQSWVKLPDDSILTFANNFQSQRYIPSLGAWIPDANLSVQLYNFATEIGPGLLLPDGRAFFLGSTGTNVFYTPSGDTTHGKWTQAANTPSPFCAWDNPAAAMVNGKLLCFFGCGQNPNGIYEFDPVADTFTLAGNWDTSGNACSAGWKHSYGGWQDSSRSHLHTPWRSVARRKACHQQHHREHRRRVLSPDRHETERYLRRRGFWRRRPDGQQLSARPADRLRRESLLRPNLQLEQYWGNDREQASDH